MDWKKTLAPVRVGDIIHAAAPPARLICLVLSSTPTLLHTRTVTSQYSISFDRSTGTAPWGPDFYKIDSIARLPDDVFDLMLQIDQKYGASDATNNTPEYLESQKLTLAERNALIFTGRFYAAHPIG